MFSLLRRRGSPGRKPAKGRTRYGRKAPVSFATLFGLVTSRGFGAGQANAGRKLLSGVAGGNANRIFRISAITGVATLLPGGGLAALQAMALTVGFPFTPLLPLTRAAIFMGLRDERRLAGGGAPA